MYGYWCAVLFHAQSLLWVWFLWFANWGNVVSFLFFFSNGFETTLLFTWLHGSGEEWCTAPSRYLRNWSDPIGGRGDITVSGGPGRRNCITITHILPRFIKNRRLDISQSPVFYPGSSHGVLMGRRGSRH